MGNNQKPWLKAAEAARNRGVSKRTFYSWMERYEDFPARKIGGCWWVDMDELDSWFRSRPNPVKETAKNLVEGLL